MRKKQNNKWFVVGFIFILVLILILLIAFGSNDNSNLTNLNLTEKKWIENNEKEVINVSVANNIPIFSNEGAGVFHDFIDLLEEDTKLTFYQIPYDASNSVEENDLYFEVVKQDKVSDIKENEMIFYKDYYVLVGKDNIKVSSPENIKNKKIGALSNVLSNLSYYVSSNDVTYQTYKEESDLQDALKNGEVDYIAIPKIRFLSFILENDYHIVYNITELKEVYVLRTSSQIDESLKSIVNKKFLKYEQENLTDSYEKLLVELLMEKNEISEKSKADFLSKKYVFGYIENPPYTDMINNKLIGLDGTYINSFSKISGATFTFKKYNSVKDLSKALSNNEVDVAPNYYNYSGLSGKFEKIVSPYEESYVVLAGSKQSFAINSDKSLNGKNVIALNNTLAKYLKDEAGAKVESYDKISNLLGEINNNSIIVLGINVYELYKHNELANYRIIYSGNADLKYGFIVNNTDENSTFSSLLSEYIETSNYKQMYHTAWKDYEKDSKEVSYTVLYIIAFLIVLFIFWMFIKKKVKIKRKLKREETIRYVDPLTSLKNRNYLNKNFSKWESNSIYPQSIIVINLNNLRHVNDVYGHEEGDKLIKLAANTLIRNQLEQSDIIRTDGNEYLIYMVGYEKNKVVAYMRKLYKELSELPYGYGATLGYSMIEDDIKTIDDAINEAVLEIRANKEMKNKK